MNLSLNASARMRTILLLVAAMAAGSLLLAPAADAVLRTTPNFRLFQDPSFPRGKDAVGLAVNPRNPRHIVEIQADLLDGECEFRTSFDGGRTWSGGDLEAPAGFQTRPCTVGAHLAGAVDAGITFGSGDNVYAAFSGARLNPDDSEQGQSALVARSANGGRSFGRGNVALRGGQPVERVPGSSPATFTGGPEYQLPKVAVDEGGGAGGSDRVYVNAANENVSADGRRDEDTSVSVSNDGGRTFSRVANANPETENAIEQSQPVVGRGGVLYIAYRTRGTVRGEAPTADGFVTVARSGRASQGRTFERTRTAQVRGYTGSEFGAAQSFTGSTFPRLAADRRSGNVYLVYGSGPNPPPQPVPGTVAAADHFIDRSLDVVFQRSTTRGATWTPPRKLNDEAPLSGEITQTRHPNVSVAPNGRVDIAWHDRRHWYRGCTNTHFECQETRLGDTYYSFSTNGGDTFSQDRRITDRSHGNDVGFDYRFGTYWDYGPIPVALGNDRVLFAWMDSREGNVDNDNQDIYLAETDLRASAARIPESTVTPRRRCPQCNQGGRISDLTVQLSRLAYPGGPEAVLASTFATRPFTRLVIVNDRDAAGALAGGVLARANIGTVLATPAGGLTPGVRAEVRRMNPIGAYVIGSEASLSNQVVGQLAANGVPRDQIRRLTASEVGVHGPDGSPAANAARIARELDRRSTADRESGSPAFDAAVIASPGTQEAATAAALAAQRRLPVLYAYRDFVPVPTRRALLELGIDKTLVIGGSRVIGPGATKDLPSPKRLGGNTFYGTSLNVVGESLARGLPKNIGYVTDGRSQAGAFMGAAVARLGGLQIVSPNPQADAARTADRLRLNGQLDRLVVVGDR